MRAILRRFRLLLLAAMLSVAALAATAPAASAWAWSSQMTVKGSVACDGLLTGRGDVGFLYVGDGNQGGFQRLQQTTNWTGQKTRSKQTFSQDFSVPGNGLTLTVMWTCGDRTLFKESIGLKRATWGNAATFNFRPNGSNQA